MNNLDADRLARAAEGARIAAFAPTGCDERRVLLSSEPGAVPSIVLTPPGATDDPPIALIHGGGWVLGAPLQDIGIARRIAVGTRRSVVSIGYRLAPEHPFPAARNDVADAMTVLMAGEVTETQRGIGDVIGFSAGAHLAMAAVLRLREAGTPLPARLVLYYGVFDTVLTGWSHRALDTDTAMLTREQMRYFVDAFLPDDRHDPAAHIIGADLSGLPPLALVCGDRDLLLSDSLTLYQRAVEGGLAASLDIIPGLDHGFAKRWFEDPVVDAALVRSLGGAPVSARALPG